MNAWLSPCDRNIIATNGRGRRAGGGGLVGDGSGGGGDGDRGGFGLPDRATEGALKGTTDGARSGGRAWLFVLAPASVRLHLLPYAPRPAEKPRLHPTAPTP